jgi:hypothetical protein
MSYRPSYRISSSVSSGRVLDVLASNKYPLLGINRAHLLLTQSGDSHTILRKSTFPGEVMLGAGAGSMNNLSPSNFFISDDAVPPALLRDEPPMRMSLLALSGHQGRGCFRRSSDTSNGHAGRRACVGRASQDRRSIYTNDIRFRPTGSNRHRP